MTASGARQTATPARVPTSTTSATLVTGGGRSTRYVYNDSAVVLYVLLGTGTASATNFTFALPAGTGQIIEGFGGPIQGVTASATGNAQVTEW